MHVIEAMHRGGAESLILEHVRYADTGTESWVCALNRGGPALEAVRALGARTVVLDKGGGHLGGLRRLTELMRRERIDVVNGHNPTGALYATIAARLAGVRDVYRTEHSLHYPGRHSRVYAHVLEPVLTAASRGVICVCEAVHRSHAPRMPWAKDTFVTIANGVSESAPARARDDVRRALGLDPSHGVVLAIGSLTKQKAQHVLVAAMADVQRRQPSARLVLVGDGPLAADLAGQVRTLGLDDVVRMPGARDDVADLIEAADVFVLSSVREGLSVTLLEAMRGARPAVVTRVGGNAEAVADGVTGLVVPTGDPPALAAALADLLGDPARARAFGEAARRRYVERYTAERMVRETEALYRLGPKGAWSAPAARAREGAERAVARA
jgi:glycosyltransferase involved in cell wall biosynthesis